MSKAKNTNDEAVIQKTHLMNALDNVSYVTPVTDFPFVYANNAIMSTSELDGAIIFGEVVGKEEGKTLVIPKVKVVMSLPFIQKLENLLKAQLEAIAAKDTDKD